MTFNKGDLVFILLHEQIRGIVLDKTCEQVELLSMKLHMGSSYVVYTNSRKMLLFESEMKLLQKAMSV